jgi:electron transfer flavoprotein alpha subunit
MRLRRTARPGARPVELETALGRWSSRHAEQRGPSIEYAEVIVAGGRGLGEPEKFALAEERAAALGGVVAATRAVVDAGWYPYSAQVGQTGKTVAPKLYIALDLWRDPGQGRHAGVERDRRD